MKDRNFIAVIGVLAIMMPTIGWSAHYEIDIDHSSVGFSIRHLMISKVKGKFDKFTGSFDYDPQNQEAWKTSVTIQAESINTGTKERDKHLRSPDFFDVKKYSTITFVSTGIKEANTHSMKLEGNLTIHGITKPVVLDVEMGGTMTDPWGNKKAAFSGSTKINRKNFGLTWNKALEAGGVVVGEEVEVNLEVEGQEKAKKGK